VATAKLGISLSVAHVVITPVWVPTGISLAGLLVFGYRVWPGVALGAAVANATSEVSLVTAGSIGVGNILEALLGTYLLRRVAGFHNSLDRVRDVIAVATLAAFVSTMASATIDTTTLLLADEISLATYGSDWTLWWLGDAMGALLVAPALLAWVAQRPPTLSRVRLLEAAALLGALVAVSYITFFGGQWSYPYALFPLLIWATLRFVSEQRLPGIDRVDPRCIGYLERLSAHCGGHPHTKCSDLAGALSDGRRNHAHFGGNNRATRYGREGPAS
jgi:integral membrane sensor domain MASE1